MSHAGRGNHILTKYIHTGLGAVWAGLFVFDSLVFCMTLYKSIVLPRPNGVNIMDILLRDGELYLPET